MIKLELEGSYYEIGLKIGEKCRNLVSSYDAEECSKDKIDFAYECQRSVEKHCPELLEELQGIADGGGFNYENLIASLGENRVYLCEGSPCKNEYKEYFLS